MSAQRVLDDLRKRDVDRAILIDWISVSARNSSALLQTMYFSHLSQREQRRKELDLYWIERVRDHLTGREPLPRHPQQAREIGDVWLSYCVDWAKVMHFLYGHHAPRQLFDDVCALLRNSRDSALKRISKRDTLDGRHVS